MTNWVALAYGIVFPTIIAFAVYAVVMAWVYQRKTKVDTEQFFTARSSVGKWKIAFSFYAGAVGSWVVTGPASYASYAGLIGCSMYAFAAGFPIMIIAICGNLIVERYPHTLSLPHFVGWRYGPIAKIVVVLIMIFVVSLAILAEYSTLGALFKDYVGTTNLPIIITIGVLTTFYTAVGGLQVSIVTDQVQAVFSVLLIVILAIYLAADFPSDLPTPITDEQIGLTYAGYSSLAAMPISLMASTVFSEAMWQRVWASESKSSLYFGAAVASVAISLVTFLFGFGGFLAAWAGYITDETNYNLYWFTLFTGGESTTLNNWQGLLTLVAAAIMSESAVDSYQNGLSSVLVSTFMEGVDIKYARMVVVIINVPLIILACFQIADKVLSLFLIGNMVTSCAAIPIVSGLIRHEKLEKYITEFGVVFGIGFSFVAVSLYGIIRTDGSAWDGFVYSWYENNYSWDYFVMAAGCSIVGEIIGCAIRVGLSYLGWEMPEVVRYHAQDTIIADSMPSPSIVQLSTSVSSEKKQMSIGNGGHL
eukprot:CFRG8372T1